MHPVETFRQADRAIEGVITAVPDDGWGRVPVPAFAADPVGGRPVRDGVAHLARDEAWIPSQLAGETMAEVDHPPARPGQGPPWPAAVAPTWVALCRPLARCPGHRSGHNPGDPPFVTGSRSPHLAPFC